MSLVAHCGAASRPRSRSGCDEGRAGASCRDHQDVAARWDAGAAGGDPLRCRGTPGRTPSVVVRDNDGDIPAAADYLDLALGLVQAAVAYYSAYPDEIDHWIERNDQDTERAHAAFMAGQAAVRP